MFVPQSGQVCSLGYDIADWIEAFCCHGPGDIQGEPVELDLEWLAFIVAAYELDPRTGRRKVDRAFMSRPKGRAKSELAGFIAVAEAFAPVRFDGWSADGQPVGRPVVSPLIKCLATEETQAGNTFENAAFIVCDYGRDAHPEVFGGASGVRQYQSARSIYLPHGGEMSACTSGAASKDGGRETFVVPDETHLYVTNELRNMYATVARNCGKRKLAEPWMLQTSTAYKVGQNSVAEQVLTAWRDGKLPNQGHWLVDHREAAGAVHLKDKTHTMRQLRQVYGAASAWMDLDRIYRTMLDPTECETPDVAAQYFLNIPSVEKLKGSAINPGLWLAQGDAKAERGRDVLFALDVAPDHSSATVAAAWKRPDGGSQVVLAAHLSGVEGVAQRCSEILTSWGGRLLMEKAGTASFLRPDLDALGVKVEEVDRRFFIDGCAALDAGLSAGTIWHRIQPELTAATEVAQWSLSATTGARVLSRKDPRVSPLVAATLALHGLSLPSVDLDLSLSVW